MREVDAPTTTMVSMSTLSQDVCIARIYAEANDDQRARLRAFVEKLTLASAGEEAVRCFDVALRLAPATKDLDADALVRRDRNFLCVRRAGDEAS